MLFCACFDRCGRSMVFLSSCLSVIHLSMVALDFRCFLQAFSSCGKWGLPPVALCRLLAVVFSCCGAWAWMFHSIWDLPRPGLEPALAGGLLTFGPSGKSLKFSSDFSFCLYNYPCSLSKISNPCESILSHSLLHADWLNSIKFFAVSLRFF